MDPISLLLNAKYLAADGSIKTLTATQTQVLVNKKYPGTDYNIIETSKEITYEIICLLYKAGYDHVLELMDNKNSFSVINEETKERNLPITINNGILFGNKLMKESQARKIEDDEIFKRGEIKSIGAFQCGVCNSWNTETTQKQVRSADEPMTCFNKCIACGHKWVI
jgi:DNA-directed RNA polymerase subunit M/transcription elongation factor TFIIS